MCLLSESRLVRFRKQCADWPKANSMPERQSLVIACFRGDSRCQSRRIAPLLGSNVPRALASGSMGNLRILLAGGAFRRAALEPGTRRSVGRHESLFPKRLASVRVESRLRGLFCTSFSSKQKGSTWREKCARRTLGKNAGFGPNIYRAFAPSIFAASRELRCGAGFVGRIA